MKCTFILHINCRLLKYKVLPSDNVSLDNYTKENKMLKILGVEYISYHRCPSDCIISKDEYENEEISLKCGHDR